MGTNHHNGKSINGEGVGNRPAGLAADTPNDAISKKLKALYAAAEQQAIPDRFLDLLEKLDEAERASKTAKQK